MPAPRWKSSLSIGDSVSGVSEIVLFIASAPLSEHWMADALLNPSAFLARKFEKDKAEGRITRIGEIRG